MKKLLSALLSLLLFAGCSPAPTEGYVRPLELDREQQGIVELLGLGQGALLFEFDSLQRYTHLDIWVEVYHDGELLEPRFAALALSEPEGRRWQGRVAATVTETPDIAYHLAVQEEKGVEYSTSTIDPPTYPDHGTTTRSYGGMEQAAVIENGREIILYAGLYTSRDEWVIYNTQEYAADPDKIKTAEYLHLIKCRFYGE